MEKHVNAGSNVTGEREGGKDVVKKIQDVYRKYSTSSDVDMQVPCP